MLAVPRVATTTSCLAERIAALRDGHAQLWRTTRCELPVLGARVGLRRHYSNARAAARLIDRLAAEGAHVPGEPAARRAWQESVRTRLQVFGDERLGWPAGYRRLLFGDAYFKAAGDFARAARLFDSTLSLDDLWQALRNIWIGNSFQMLLGLPVMSTPSLFAYSMLYPLTDNLLDDPSLTPAAKRAFNDRFGRRLAGLAVEPATAGEAAVFRLVAMIERQFPRPSCPDVHDSLLAIHHGQVLSLLQQHDPAIADDALLSITCEKGGSSVVADLYLVAGTASEVEEEFAFGYGVALQLMDDLQDVERDRRAGHQTIFTRAAGRSTLDADASRLLAFIDRVLDRWLDNAGSAGSERTRPTSTASERTRPTSTASERTRPTRSEDDQIDLLRRNCRSLVVGAVAEQPSFFSSAFRRRLERGWPFTLGALRRLRRRAHRRLPLDRAAYLLADAADNSLSAV